MNLNNIKNKKNLLIIFAFLFIFNVFFGCFDSYAIEQKKALYVANFKEDQIFENKNANTALPIGSISKLMVYLIAIEHINKNSIPLKTIVTISKNASKTEGSSLLLKEGEKISLRDLINGMLIVSGNDATVAISEFVSKTEKSFVEKMNKKAKELGLNTMHFINSSGLNINGKNNISSARDLFLLSKIIISKHPEILKITKHKDLIQKKRKFQKPSTNKKLLTNLKGVDGLKTGYTEEAGFCLVSTMKDSFSKERIISVVLGEKTNDARTEVSKKSLEKARDEIKLSFILKKKKLESIIKKPEFLETIMYFME